jgi:hypothetical protein
MIYFICLHWPPIASQAVLADVGQKMFRFGEVSNKHSPALQKPDLILNGCSWFSISHGQKNTPSKQCMLRWGIMNFLGRL